MSQQRTDCAGKEKNRYLTNDRPPPSPASALSSGPPDNVETASTNISLALIVGICKIGFPSQCDQQIRLRHILRAAPPDLVKRSHPRPDAVSSNCPTLLFIQLEPKGKSRVINLSSLGVGNVKNT